MQNPIWIMGSDARGIYHRISGLDISVPPSSTAREEKRAWKVTVNWVHISLLGDKKVLELDSDDGCTTL